MAQKIITLRELIALSILGAGAYIAYLETGDLRIAGGAFVAGYIAMTGFIFRRRGGLRRYL